MANLSGNSCWLGDESNSGFLFGCVDDEIRFLVCEHRSALVLETNAMQEGRGKPYQASLRQLQQEAPPAPPHPFPFPLTVQGEKKASGDANRRDFD